MQGLRKEKVALMPDTGNGKEVRPGNGSLPEGFTIHLGSQRVEIVSVRFGVELLCFGRLSLAICLSRIPE